MTRRARAIWLAQRELASITMLVNAFGLTYNVHWRWPWNFILLEQYIK